MNINLLHCLLVVNNYLCYPCEDYMNRKLTIFLSANLFQQRKILMLKAQQKDVLPNISFNIEQNSSPVKFYIYFKRITKTFI